jgi:hypothetical protein
MAEQSKSTQSGRRSWKDRVRERQPDLDVDDELAVGDYLGDTFDKYDKGLRERQQFNDMLTSDPNTAGIVEGMATGQDENGQPFSVNGYLMEKYYDIISDAESREEAVRRVREREAEDIRKAAEGEKRKAESEKELAKSDAALTRAVQAANADAATCNAMLTWLYGQTADDEGFVHRVAARRATEEDWSRLLYAFMRDGALDAAREDGRKQGMRSRPGAAHRQMSSSGITDLGSGGGADGALDDSDPTLQRYGRMGRRF